MNPELGADELERRLSQLEADSEGRRNELSAIIDELPATVSRRGVFVAGLRDLRAVPKKHAVVVPVVRRLGRIPGALIRRLRARFAD